MSDAAPATPDAKLLRRLAFYRGLLVLLAAATGVLGWALDRAVARLPAPAERTPAPASSTGATPAAPSASGRPQIIDVAAAAARLAGQYRDRTDAEMLLFKSASTTVSLHVLGLGQMTPLHIHRTSAEVTVVVSGAPSITQVWRGGRAARAAGPGTVVHSPPFCAHEFANGATDAMQANLVISSPPFDGNLFVRPDDARIGAAAPLVIDPDAELAALASSGQRRRVREVGSTPGMARTWLAVVAEDLGIAAQARSPTIVYVLRGEGTLVDHRPGAAGEPIALGAQQLVAVPPLQAAAVGPKPGTTLALLMFTPDEPTAPASPGADARR